MKTYDMKHIFRQVTAWSESQYDTKTKYNRIGRIINFINNSNIIDNSGYFMDEIINLKGQKLESSFKGYKFNIVTYIFLVCLCKSDKLPFFDKAIDGKYSTEEEAEEWIKTITTILAGYEEFYKKESKKNDWQSIYVNIGSIYYSFTNIERNSENINYINERIIDIFSRIIALPDDDKVKLYNSKIRNRFNYIDNSLKETLDNMDRHNKNLYNIDLEAIKDKLKLYRP